MSGSAYRIAGIVAISLLLHVVLYATLAKWWSHARTSGDQ